MRRSGFSTAIYVLLVFLSGAVVGGFAHRLYMMNSVKAAEATMPKKPSPEEWRRQYVDEMRTRLSLDAAQLVKLEEILNSTRQRYRELHEKSRPEMKVIKDAHVASVNAILTESQRPEYEKLRAERELRRQQLEKKP